MRHPCVMLLLILAISIFTTIKTAASVVISATTGGSSTATKGVGDSFTIDLEIDNWNTADSVDAIQFDVTFDTAVFSYNPGSGVALTAGANTFMTLDPTGGPIVDSSNDVLTAATGTFVFSVVDNAINFTGSGPQFVSGPMDLGSLGLTANTVTAPGSSTITLSNFSFVGPFGGSVSPTGGGVSPSNLTITVVPEPSPMLMLGGIGLLVLVSRRRIRQC